MKTYRVLSALLTYPTEDLAAAVPEMEAILAEDDLVSAEDRAALVPLLTDIASMDIYDLQARYVELFDQNRALSLHLFEHVHGESRDRGEAMVSLMERYTENGLSLAGNELPDFLPVFLEFLSQLPADEARQELADPRAVIAVLSRRLQKRESPYAAVLGALEHLGAERASATDVEALERAEAEEAKATPSPDAEWEEAPVDFSRREASFVGRQHARAQGASFRKER